MEHQNGSLWILRIVFLFRLSQCGMTTIKIWNLERFSAWFFALNRMQITSAKSGFVCVQATHFRSSGLSNFKSRNSGEKTSQRKIPRLNGWEMSYLRENCLEECFIPQITALDHRAHTPQPCCFGRRFGGLSGFNQRLLESLGMLDDMGPQGLLFGQEELSKAAVSLLLQQRVRTGPRRLAERNHIVKFRHRNVRQQSGRDIKAGLQ